MRRSNRGHDEIREINIQTGFMGNAHGSCLIECGRTRVLCSCMLQDGVPPFLEGTGRGWLTAEYAMLPGSTLKRKPRETLKPDGRATEIKRLIGRSLRTVVDFRALGENTMFVDCDVIEADGGTRTAAISGAFVAVALASHRLLHGGVLTKSPVLDYVAAISAGCVDNKPLLDLDYLEDSAAQADMNIVMTGAGELVEVQCTGEKRALRFDEFYSLIELGKRGIERVLEAQQTALYGLDIVGR